MTQNNFLNSVESLLRKNDIAFDKKELSFQIQSHPSYPSLHAITAVLDHFNIENVAATIPVNMDTLGQLPPAFMAQVNTQLGSDLVTVTRKKNKYQVSPSVDSISKLNADDLLKLLTGVVVVVESEGTNKKSRRQPWLRKLIGALPGIPFLSLFILSDPSVLTVIYFLLALAGSIISITIIKQELGQKTSLGNAFCSSVNERKDCDAVLGSKGASLSKWLKISDLSLVYFASFLIGILVFSDTYVLHYLSIIVLPVSVYSIYYQWRIVKKWCLMCLSIVAILWAQATLSIVTISPKLFIQTEWILSLSLVMLTTFSLWSFFRPQYEELLKGERTKLDFHKFKRNFNLFSTLLDQALYVDTKISTHEIILGNKSSNTEILIVTNPFCGHCKSVHSLVEKILKQYGKEVKIIIRFNISNENPESEIIRITARLIEIFDTDGASICLEAMTDIYGDMSGGEWLSKWSEVTDISHYRRILGEQRSWCVSHQINFTPHLSINGRAFPEAYERRDLIFFIEELGEQSARREETNELAIQVI